MFKSKSSINLTLFLVLIMAFLEVSAYAQGICDYKEFRLERIKGRVISNGPKGYEPISQAKVELWRVGVSDKEDKLIISAMSDEDGYFEIDNIKDGVYRLNVSTTTKGFFSNFAGIKIVKKAKKTERKKLLVFRLGVEALKPCGGGEVFLVRR